MAPATSAVIVTRRTPSSPRMACLRMVRAGRARRCCPWPEARPGGDVDDDRARMCRRCAPVVGVSWRLALRAAARPRPNRTGSGTLAPYTGRVPTCTLGANGPPPAARRQRAHLPGLLRPHRPAADDLEGRARDGGLRLYQHRPARDPGREAGPDRRRLRPPRADLPP